MPRPRDLAGPRDVLRRLPARNTRRARSGHLIKDLHLKLGLPQTKASYRLGAMRDAYIVVLLTLAANLAACGFVLPGRPQWCGAVVSGGPGVLPPDTPRPIATPDPDHLLCIAMENHSDVDMGFSESRGDGPKDWGLISACSGVAASEANASEPWAIEVGRTKPGALVGPVLASFDSSRLTGEPPYLIEVVIDPDKRVTIDQRSSLSEDPASRKC
jgi:hypothetical protein